MCKGAVCEGSHCLSQCRKRWLSIRVGPGDEGENYWDSILWSDETKVNVFKGEEYDEECMVPMVPHPVSRFWKDRMSIIPHAASRFWKSSFSKNVEICTSMSPACLFHV